MTFYPNILVHKQKALLERLTFFHPFGFYMAGGTALALQLGHRTSLDFDFYSKEKLESEKFAMHLRQLLPSTKISHQTDDTFLAIASGVNISVFYYPYQLLRDFVDFSPVQLASLEDIAAMKIVAIVQRARQRDFLDLYYLIERLGMAEVVTSAYKKYPWYEENNQIVLTALTYFEEANKDDEAGGITVFDKNLQWKNVKEKIRHEVKKYLEAP